MMLRFVESTGPRMTLADKVPVPGMVMPDRTFSFVVPSRSPIQPGVHSKTWQLLSGPDGEAVPIPNPNKVWVTVTVP